MSDHTTLYASDLDGTLLGADSRISPRSAVMLNEAISRGAMFTVATARTPATVAYLLKDIDMKLPAVVMTGSALWDPRTGRYSSVCYIPEHQVRAALEVYRRHALPTFVYTLHDDMIHMYHIGHFNAEETAFLEERIGNPFKTAHLRPGEGDVLPPDLGKTVLLFAIQPTALAEPVARDLRKATDCVINCYNDLTYGPDNSLLEVFAPGSSKASAVKRLAQAAGASRIMAFGDNINDLPMLAAADKAVAVANAVPEVLARAGKIIGPNTSDAVPEAIIADFCADNDN